MVIERGMGKSKTSSETDYVPELLRRVAPIVSPKAAVSIQEKKGKQGAPKIWLANSIDMDGAFYIILNEYFWELKCKIALWECC